MISTSKSVYTCVGFDVLGFGLEVGGFGFCADVARKGFDTEHGGSRVVKPSTLGQGIPLTSSCPFGNAYWRVLRIFHLWGESGALSVDDQVAHVIGVEPMWNTLNDLKDVSLTKWTQQRP